MCSVDEEISKVEQVTTHDSGLCSAAVVNVAQKVCPHRRRFPFFADFSCTPTNQWPPSLVQRQLLAEAIGTFFVVFAGCGSVVVNKMYGSVTFPGICITWGLIVMVMVYSVGHISGAHFNPAVTTTFAILKQFPFKQLPLYIVAQLVGAILASGALYLLFDPKAEHFYGTTPVGSAVQSFVLEIIISFLLMFVISGVATDTRAVGGDDIYLSSERR
ncbi:hypothetical protein BHM03_00027393 [Ensete ventricosum]|nr:hypothetical protein BHM03_00027393 [Ensete ventricosum]